jgi:hypothetical protein
LWASKKTNIARSACGPLGNIFQMDITMLNMFALEVRITSFIGTGNYGVASRFILKP